MLLQSGQGQPVMRRMLSHNVIEACETLQSQAVGSVVSLGGDEGLSHSPEAHQNFVVSTPAILMVITKSAGIFEASRRKLRFTQSNQEQ